MIFSVLYGYITEKTNILHKLILQAAAGGESLSTLQSVSAVTPTTSSTKSPTDGLLANLQERLIQTESGISVLSTNTDLRTLADLATMSSDKPSQSSAVFSGTAGAAAGILSNTGSLSSNGDNLDSQLHNNNSSHADSIARAFDR